MKRYDVTIPVAGHIVLTVEAESEKDAIEKALETDVTRDQIEEWTMLKQFHQGNVCYCPSPWEATAELAFGETEDEETEAA